MNQVVLYEPCSPMSTRMTLFTTESSTHAATMPTSHFLRYSAKSICSSTLPFTLTDTDMARIWFCPSHGGRWSR